MDAVGSVDPDFLNGLFAQIRTVSQQGFEFDQGRINFMLAVIKGEQPRSQLEAMLLAQMAAVYMAMMGLAGDVVTMPHHVPARMFYNLARTFAAQMDALWRYRAAAEQTAARSRNAANDGNEAVGGQPAPGATSSSQPAAADLQQQPAKPTADQPAGMVVPLKRKSSK
jgi:hypothetical protein